MYRIRTSCKDLFLCLRWEDVRRLRTSSSCKQHCSSCQPTEQQKLHHCNGNLKQTSGRQILAQYKNRQSLRFSSQLACSMDKLGQLASFIATCGMSMMNMHAIDHACMADLPVQAPPRCALIRIKITLNKVTEDMAFFDNPKALLAHLRHSFITSDDTGTPFNTYNQ